MGGMGHVQRLELQYDGPIPPRLLIAAQALDAAERRTRAAPRPDPGCKVGAIRYKPGYLVAQIAQAMLNAAALTGECRREHLIGLGFTARELDQYGGEAAHIAATKAGMRQPIERGN